MNTEILLSTVLVCATIIYTIVTIFQLLESRKVRLQKENPNIIAYLKSGENHESMYLIIKNFGEGVAKNVKVNFKKDFARFSREDFLLSTIGIAENGMNYFPTQHHLQFAIGAMITLFENNKTDVLEIEISYCSLNDRKFSRTFELPLNQIFGQSYSKPTETFLGQIPYYLKEINSELKKINTHIENKK